ncbi:hypothetical protein B5X24_HaOG209150 [Helicoverpa armigera]|nr:hypothetical protein B5X24_HaOG209150 [Helicoverpa armigera]
MSEYYKEQHPLLCEDISEEEHYSPRYPRRLRSSTYRGRARNNLKGAASIITRWPDHWSSFVAYWWIGLGMISLMTFVVYNSLFAFSMLPTANLKPASLIIANKNARILPKTSCPDVFMHIFAKPTEEVDFGQYMPYIEALSDKYPNVKYHLMVVVNDTTNLGWLSAEENNEIALNSLWNKNPKKEPIYSNIAIEYITLSAYMENSPLRKYWRSLPHQLIEFLSRAISIWDKGGIAFDPIILTPKSQHTIYTEKIQKLLDKYAEVDKTLAIDPPNQESDAVIEKNRLTIDLKGNIIATDTACHAFLGTIFSNAIHHSQEESVTDFIIAELTIFCKGLLSSCMGIDLILL